jgi:hypothetical protein
MCKAPIGIEVQSINYQTGNWDYEWQLTETSDNISVISFYSLNQLVLIFVFDIVVQKIH